MITRTENFSIGVRLPEGMDPHTPGVGRWKMGVQAGIRAYEDFLRTMDTEEIPGESTTVDLSGYSSIIEASDVTDRICRLRLRVGNAGDDSDFEPLVMGTLEDVEKISNMISKHRQAVLSR